MKLISIFLFGILFNGCTLEIEQSRNQNSNQDDTNDLSSENNDLRTLGSVSLNIHSASNSLKGYNCDISTSILLGGIPETQLPPEHSFWILNEMNCVITGNTFQGEIQTNTKQFVISGNFGENRTGFANVNIDDVDTNLTLVQENCQITDINDVDDYDLKVQFDCSKLVSIKNTQIWCSSQGVFIFKNCDSP